MEKEAGLPGGIAMATEHATQAEKGKYNYSDFLLL